MILCFSVFFFYSIFYFLILTSSKTCNAVGGTFARPLFLKGTLHSCYGWSKRSLVQDNCKVDDIAWITAITFLINRQDVRDLFFNDIIDVVLY